MIIGRNLTSQKEFTHPRTEACTDRVINLISPTIDILKNQAEMTRLGKQYQIEVKLMEDGRSEIHPCTFVFNPQIVTRNGLAGPSLCCQFYRSNVGYSDKAFWALSPQSISVQAYICVLVFSRGG